MTLAEMHDTEQGATPAKLTLLFLLRQGTQALEMHLRFFPLSSLAASFLLLLRPLSARPASGSSVETSMLVSSGRDGGGGARRGGRAQSIARRYRSSSSSSGLAAIHILEGTGAQSGAGVDIRAGVASSMRFGAGVRRQMRMRMQMRRGASAPPGWPVRDLIADAKASSLVRRPWSSDSTKHPDPLCRATCGCRCFCD